MVGGTERACIFPQKSEDSVRCIGSIRLFLAHLMTARSLPPNLLQMEDRLTEGMVQDLPQIMVEQARFTHQPAASTPPAHPCQVRRKVNAHASYHGGNDRIAGENPCADHNGSEKDIHDLLAVSKHILLLTEAR
jgi:hypothetical protein